MHRQYRSRVRNDERYYRTTSADIASSSFPRSGRRVVCVVAASGRRGGRCVRSAEEREFHDLIVRRRRDANVMHVKAAIDSVVERLYAESISGHCAVRVYGDAAIVSSNRRIGSRCTASRSHATEECFPDAHLEDASRTGEAHGCQAQASIAMLNGHTLGSSTFPSPGRFAAVVFRSR